MTDLAHDVRTMCSSCGTWYWAGDGHTCPPSSPTNLATSHPGTTVRYSVDEAFRLHLEAVINHPAETVVRRPHFSKEYSL